MPIVAAAKTNSYISGEIALKMTKAFYHIYEWKYERESARQFTVTVLSPVWQNSSKRVVRDENIILAFDGRVHDSNGGGLVSAETLLELYNQHGIRALYALNGLYVILIWDNRNQSLTLVNDRHGFHKLYYCVFNDMLVLSTQMKAIVEIMPYKPKIDEVAVAQLLSVGYPMGNRTLIDGIKRIGPATVLIYKSQEINESSYWQYSISSDTTLSLADCADLIADAIKKSVERRIEGNEKLVLPCTGGLDSRTLAGFIGQYRKDVIAYSYGHRHTYDVRYGRKIAHAMGFMHKYLHLPEKYIELFWPKAIEVTEGEVSSHAFHIWRLNQAGPTGANIFTGFLGDVLSGVRYEYSGSYQEKIEKLFRWCYLSGFSDYELQSLFIAGVRGNIKNAVKEVLMENLADARADCFEDKSVIVGLIQRQRRFIAYHLDLLSRNFTVDAPFTDPDVVDVFFKIPLRYRLNKQTYIKMISKYLPAVADIKYEVTGKTIHQMDSVQPANTSSGYPFKNNFIGWIYLGLKWRTERLTNKLNIRKTWLQTQKSLKDNTRKTSAILSNGWLGEHNRRAYAHYDEIIRSSSREFFITTLLDSDYLTDWFNIDEIKRVLDEHIKRKSNHYEKINNLVTFVLFRKFFNI